MARAMVQEDRDDKGEFRPVGVWLATEAGVEARMLPGSASRDRYMQYVLADVSRQTINFTNVTGTWEDWIEWATWSLSDMQFHRMTEVAPAVTLDRLYAREVLGETVPGPAFDQKFVPTELRGDTVRELHGGLGGPSTRSTEAPAPLTRSNPPTEATSASLPSPQTESWQEFRDRLQAESRGQSGQPSNVTILVPPKRTLPPA